MPETTGHLSDKLKFSAGQNENLPVLSDSPAVFAKTGILYTVCTLFENIYRGYQHNGDIECYTFGFIMKTCLYNFDPLKPHFYIVKLGFTGVYIIFLISAQKHRLWVLIRIDCVYSLEPPHRGGSNEQTQSMF